MILTNVIGGFCGTALFLTAAAICESWTHDGKGKTLNEHMGGIMFVMCGTVVSFVVGSWIAPGLIGQ